MCSLPIRAACHIAVMDPGVRCALRFHKILMPSKYRSQVRNKLILLYPSSL